MHYHSHDIMEDANVVTHPNKDEFCLVRLSNELWYRDDMLVLVNNTYRLRLHMTGSVYLGIGPNVGNLQAGSDFNNNI